MNYIPAPTWMNIKHVILSGRSQVQNSIYMTFLKCHNYKGRDQIRGFQGLRIKGEDKGLTTKVHMEIFWGDGSLSNLSDEAHE